MFTQKDFLAVYGVPKNTMERVCYNLLGKVPQTQSINDLAHILMDIIDRGPDNE